MRIFISLVFSSIILASCSTGGGLLDKDLKRNSVKIPVTGVEFWKENGMFRSGDLEVNNITRDWMIPFRSPSLTSMKNNQDRYGFQLANSESSMSRVYCVNRILLDSLEIFKDLIPEEFTEQDLFYTHILTGTSSSQIAWFMVLPTPQVGKTDTIKEGFFRNLKTIYTVKELRNEGEMVLEGYQWFDEADKAVAAIILGEEEITGYVHNSVAEEQQLLFQSAFASIALKTADYSVFN